MNDELVTCIRIALKNNVTDIHFNLNQKNELIVDMRVNGVIKRLKNHHLDASFFRYLLYRANLDVSKSFLPQTGQFEIIVDNKKLSLRLALLNSMQMSSAVLRILNNHESLKIEHLTNNPAQIQWFKQITSNRNGLYLFSGPTGSGKTTSLYTILNEENRKKIFTLEDPIEVYFDKFIQIQINEKQNLSYQDGIKQLMRHDPDIIMIGEIRDSIAAEMAVRSALTGHLVVSSIHSYSCKGAIERMLDLGVSQFQLFDVLHGVTNQRLYTTTANTKIGIYEMMDRKEVLYYQNNHTTSPTFIPIQENIQKNIEEGILSMEEVKQDY